MLGDERPDRPTALRRAVLGVVVDVDDTLVLTATTGFRKCVETAGRLGLQPPTHEQFAASYGTLSFDDCVRTWHGDVDADTYRAVYDGLADAVPAVPVGGVAALVARCRASGLRVAVLTNGPADKTRRKLAVCGLEADALDGVWDGDSLEHCKPDPRCFDAVVSAWRLPRRSLLYVGDAPVDRDAALHAGLLFVGVRTGPRKEELSGCAMRPSVLEVLGELSG